MRTVTLNLSEAEANAVEKNLRRDVQSALDGHINGVATLGNEFNALVKVVNAIKASTPVLVTIPKEKPVTRRKSRKPKKKVASSRAVLYQYKGEKKPLSEWSELFGIPKNTLHFRIQRGWSIKKTLTTPPLSTNHKHVARMKRENGKKK